MEVNTTMETPKERLGVQVWVGCAVCSIACLFTALVIMGFRLVKSVRSYIRVNFLLMLGSAELFFLAGGRYTNVPGVCTIVASWLHYSVLGSFAWLLAYVLFLGEEIKARNDDHSLSVVIYSFIGWLLPAVVVIIALVWRYTDYRSSDYCWIGDNFTVRILFEGPLLAFALFTFLLLVYVLVTYWRVDPERRKIRYSVAGSGLRSCVLLLPLMTLVWMCCSYMVSTRTLWMQWLFTAANCLLGVLVFLLMLWFNEEILQARRSRPGSGVKRVKHEPPRRTGGVKLATTDEGEEAHIHVLPMLHMHTAAVVDTAEIEDDQHARIPYVDDEEEDTEMPSTSTRKKKAGSPDSHTELMNMGKKSTVVKSSKSKKATSPV